MAPWRDRHDSERPGVVELVGQLADGLGKLLAQHIVLAKMELVEEAREVGTDAGKVAAYLPFVLVGYALWCAALSALLARWIGWTGGFFAVGTVNVLVGGLGIWRAVSRLRARKPVLGETLAEMKSTAGVLKNPEEGVPPQVTVALGEIRNG